jgi:hypothetical protein
MAPELMFWFYRNFLTDPAKVANQSRVRPAWHLPVSAILFLLIPVVFVISVAELTKAKGPQWLPFTFENPYNYLFNSLLLLKGQAPYSIQHPGTTTQVFGAIVLRASSLKSTDDLISSVLHYPEKHIQLLHRALLIFTTFVLWLAPWITALALRNYLVGLLIQLPTLFYSYLLWYGVLFGPDLMVVPFSIAAVCCCALLVAPCGSVTRLAVIFGIGKESDGASSTRLIRIPLLAAVTGLVCALGVVTKLTFFPLILISLLYCLRRRNLLTFTVAFILGLAVALLPIYSQLPVLLTWTFNLGIHSGRYDSGAIGLPDAGAYLSFLSDVLENQALVAIIPIVSISVVILLSFLARKQAPANRIDWPTSLCLLAIQAISFFVIVKEAGIHYLIPLSLTTGLNLVFLFQACRSVERSPFKKAVGWIALLGLIALGAKDFIEKTPATYADLRKQKLDLLRLYRHAKDITQNDVRVDYFFSDSPIYPLCYGNAWAGGAFGPLLASIYPNLLFFNVYNGQFHTFTQWITPEAIREKYDHLYFLGTPRFFPKVKGFEPGTFENIDHVGDYYLQKWTRK